ncbi:MAG TPA: hypothetical protein VMC85_13065 [Desulfomonilaceae bacterium]|nr:hypothetical protein [Desulfomonilaceae bacterium]HVN77804.1 hypothetical protein [Terriglobia bacterium]
MKTSLYVAILIATLAVVPILSSAVLAAQDSAGSDHNLCIQSCAWPFSNNAGQYQTQANCTVGCDSSFWKAFDRKARELDKGPK